MGPGIAKAWWRVFKVVVPAAAVVAAAVIAKCGPVPGVPPGTSAERSEAERPSTDRPLERDAHPPRGPSVREMLGAAREAAWVAVVEAGVTCREYVRNQTVTVRLSAKSEFYPLGRYKLTDSPRANTLARSIARIDRSLSPLRGPQYGVTVDIGATADSHPIVGMLRYAGPAWKGCETDAGLIALAPGELLDNESLACARSAEFGAFLIGSGFARGDISTWGKELLDRGGEHRFVDVTIKYEDILDLVPDFQICPVDSQLD